MDQFAELTGRSYRLFDYFGATDAERVIIIMGSGAEAVEETVEDMLGNGEKVGLLRVRLYRPFSVNHLLDALPATVNGIAVLDRCKEPGAAGEPLYKDVVTGFAEHVAAGGEKFASLPRILGGRYGLSSKEFTPGMIRAVFTNLSAEKPKNQFTIGIHDDVSHTSLEWDDSARNADMQGIIQCLFYGLGSDGTVSANKNTLKIIGEETDQFVQGYFVYDSKKAGAVTVSHLRFSPRPIRSSYLIEDGEASFIGCHQPQFAERFNLLEKAADGAVFLLNSSDAPDQVWNTLPKTMQQEMLDKNIKLWVIDAYAVAKATGMGRRINTIMQTCFFAISGVLPRDEAIEKIKHAVVKTYGRKGRKIVQRNFDAIDASLAALHEVTLPESADSDIAFRPPVSEQAPEFVRSITATLIAGKGDELPVSAIPADGSWPLGTAAWEKRSIALELPKWDAELCIECGKCPFVCPHAAIRSKVFTEDALKEAPEGFLSRPMKGKEFTGLHVAYQVAPDDCTGCGICADVCPARDKTNVGHKSLDMVPKDDIIEQDRKNWAFFETLPEYDRELIAWPKMKSAMLSQPLFEFSGACLGCGETPYIRLATQMFGDRMLVANATGCSSIYGGNLPTTPYTTNPEGRGPAWSNSLFEDNAEFGLGFRLAVDQHRHQAEVLLAQLGDVLDTALVQEILSADQSDEPGIHQQRQRVEKLKQQLAAMDRDKARRLLSIADYLVKKSVWIIGGDGWAYDIGFGGLDHALASGKDINLLVLDTEVYSNTGGQTSKATPRGAVAKFSAGGKAAPKKDLGMIAMAYENVYVASISSGAKDVHTLKALMEAESYPGPSIILAYSPCIAHGVDLSNNLRQQKLAINSGHWPLYRYDPRRREKGLNPLQLDYKKPSIPLKEYYETEARFAMLWRSHPKEADVFLALEQEAVLDRYHHLEQLAALPVEEPEETES
jgi:pyruvate-ferredoxin/flavodoxin oxidoreductase